MNYYEDDGKKGKLWGILGVALYIVLCVGLMFVTYTIELPQPELGILVDFGTVDKAGGATDLPVSKVDTRPVSPQRQNRPAEQVMTTEEPDAPEIVEEPNPDPKPSKPVEETAPQREVNQKALFPGRTEGSTSTSQGSSEGEGNQGAQEGGPDGSDSAGGSGSSGFSLSGRYLIGQLPRPAYNSDAEGRVVVRITVDREGKVTSAVYEQSGSTTNDGSLVTAARTAAMRARFTPSESDIQTGTITYIFRLN